MRLLYKVPTDYDKKTDSRGSYVAKPVFKVKPLVQLQSRVTGLGRYPSVGNYSQRSTFHRLMSLAGFNFNFTALFVHSFEIMSEWKSKVESVLCDSESGRRLCSELTGGDQIRKIFSIF